jgi:hypothetical protein
MLRLSWSRCVHMAMKIAEGDRIRSVQRIRGQENIPARGPRTFRSNCKRMRDACRACPSDREHRRHTDCQRGPHECQWGRREGATAQRLHRRSAGSLEGGHTVDFTSAGPKRAKRARNSSTYACRMQFVTSIASVVATWAAALTLICHFEARGRSGDGKGAKGDGKE